MQAEVCAERIALKMKMVKKTFRLDSKSHYSKFDSGYEHRFLFEIKLSTVNLDTAGNHSKLNVDTAGNHSTLKLDTAGNHSQPNVDTAGHQRSAKSYCMHKRMQNWTF